ncbi:MAG: ATP-dependent DNA ligase [Candidatus Thorarchaeota archaeon]
MKRFIQLIDDMDNTTSTNRKIDILTEYLSEIDDESAIWAIFFLLGKRIKRGISSRLLVEIAYKSLDLPKWLFNESITAVGDTSEAISLLLDLDSPDEKKDHTLSYWIEKRIIPLQKMVEVDQKRLIRKWWNECNRQEIFVLNKLITGGFYGRIGVSKGIVLRALEKITEIPKNTLQYRLMGNWEPTKEFYRNILISMDTTDADLSQPYPFFLASPLQDSLDSLGKVDEWIFEHKWDGIRAQLIKRKEKVFIWSRGEEIVTGSFPEVKIELKKLPDGIVIDGELLAYYNNEPLSFSVLQKRIGRIGKNITKKILEEAPVRLMAYDLLEFEGIDIRDKPLEERRKMLESLLNTLDTAILFSKGLFASSWEEVEMLRTQAREAQAEGLVIKRLNSTYQAGRKRGDWWKYKVDPLSLDVVMLYVQAGSGKRANYFTDYTFAVWSSDKKELLPIGKSYKGLTDEEIKELDNWIRKNTYEKFGPVRTVKPEQIFELGFDSVIENKRVKSGITLRFSRILRWRKDKTIADINTIDDAKELLKYMGKTVNRNHDH